MPLRCGWNCWHRESLPSIPIIHLFIRSHKYLQVLKPPATHNWLQAIMELSRHICSFKPGISLDEKNIDVHRSICLQVKLRRAESLSPADWSVFITTINLVKNILLLIPTYSNKKNTQKWKLRLKFLCICAPSWEKRHQNMLKPIIFRVES